MSGISILNPPPSQYIIFYTGGLSNTLFTSLLVSKMFCTKGCMGGGERDIVNSLRPAREGGRGGEGTK